MEVVVVSWVLGMVVDGLFHDVVVGGPLLGVVAWLVSRCYEWSFVVCC